MIQADFEGPFLISRAVAHAYILTRPWRTSLPCPRIIVYVVKMLIWRLQPVETLPGNQLALKNTIQVSHPSKREP